MKASSFGLRLKVRAASFQGVPQEDIPDGLKDDPVIEKSDPMIPTFIASALATGVGSPILAVLVTG